jgi:hypothetical protein
LLQPGTIDVLSVNYRTGNGMTHTETEVVDSYTAEFDASTAVKTIGIFYNSSRAHDWIAEVSLDGTTWATAADLGTVQGFAGNWTWHDIDPAYSTPYFRLRDTRPDPQGNFTSLQIDQVRLINAIYEVPLSAMSRDTYNTLPSKRSAGHPVQYYFSKQISPELVLWPEPSDTFAHLMIRRHREVQDVGTMQDTLELPNRWMQAIIWQLSTLLAFELPGVDEKRRLEIAAFAANSLSEAEDGETDGSPFYLQPKISGYTK